MKLKKILAVTLASAFAIGSLAGCGGGDKKGADSKGGNTVKVGVFLP